MSSLYRERFPTMWRACSSAPTAHNITSRKALSFTFPYFPVILLSLGILFVVMVLLFDFKRSLVNISSHRTYFCGSDLYGLRLMSLEKTKQLHLYLGCTQQWGGADGLGQRSVCYLRCQSKLRIQLLYWNPRGFTPSSAHHLLLHLDGSLARETSCDLSDAALTGQQVSRSPGKQKHSHVFCLS